MKYKNKNKTKTKNKNKNVFTIPRNYIFLQKKLKCFLHHDQYHIKKTNKYQKK